MEIPDTLLPEFYESGYRIYSFSLNGSTEGGLFTTAITPILWRLEKMD